MIQIYLFSTIPKQISHLRPNMMLCQRQFAAGRFVKDGGTIHCDEKLS